MLNNTLTNVLYIDLSKKSYHIVNRQELFEKYIGGTGVGIQLLKEECPKGCNPLSPENPIIFATGPLTPLFPLASKTVALFKSPHTGDLGESHCGGRSAVSIRMAGFGAIVIKGKSNIPIYLSIHDNKVYFKDARTLWGVSNTTTVGKIIRENEPGAGTRTIMRIGRAGEQLVTYANVTTETYRHFGRLGLGAVFGSKLLKAVVVAGKSSFPVADQKKYKALYDEIHNTAANSSVMKKYHDLGTSSNILPLNEFGGLPTRNLQQSQFEAAEEISGENFAEKYLGRRLACSHCPVGCIHIAALREPHEKEAYFYKTSMITYDYEPIYAIGSMLGGNNTKGILKILDVIERLGIDVMSVGVILSWATEAMEKGIIDKKITSGIMFRWNDYETYIKAVKLIVNKQNEFYEALSRGVEYASAKYGGQDFALAFAGNEMAGYHTGPACHIGTLVGARHGHLDNAGYSIDQNVLTKEELSPEAIAEKLVTEERWRQILSSLTVCFFARGIYTEDIVTRALNIAGFDTNKKDLARIGKEIHRAKFEFKIREGFTFDNFRIPKRIFETPSPSIEFTEDYINKSIQKVRELIFEK